MTEEEACNQDESTAWYEGECMSVEDAWEEEICLNQAFQDNPCVMEVWNAMKDNDVAYDAIERYLNEEDAQKLELCLDIQNLNIDGKTPNGNAAPSVRQSGGQHVGLSVKISLNSQKMNRSQISIARTIIHEMYHAQLMEMLFEAGKYEDFREYAENYGGEGDFLTLWNYYQETGLVSSGGGNFQHEYMAQYYVDDIAAGLKVLHPFLSSQDFINYKTDSFVGNSDKPWSWDEFFVALAWSGLEETEQYQTEIVDKGLSEDYKFYQDETNMEPIKCN